MTQQLPATIEAEALAFARSKIAQFRDGSMLMAEASREFVRHVMRRAALLHPLHMMTLIDFARAGEPDADIVLRTLAIEIVDRGEPLPTTLGAYIMETIRGRVRQRPARKRKNNLLRDILIVAIIDEVSSRFGLMPTGRSPQRRSACSIVAEALHEAHMQLGYKDIESIWNRLGRAVAGVLGWALKPS